ncbi:MAG: arginase family protein, partial [Phycisphaerales bacterium]|nr:arginase family protein [Phycisphaerales bacterium]
MIEGCAPVSWDQVPASRFASSLRVDPEGCEIGLIGIPDDTGVSLNNGRPGARSGPDAFRRALARYGALGAPIEWPIVCDCGDVVPGRDIHETHDRVTAVTNRMLDLGLFPVAIGGGHDLTFPFIRAVAGRFAMLSGVYLDAHLDVRAEVGSGMPFRALVERGAVRSLHVQGLDRFSNTKEHLEWFQSRNGHVDDLDPDGDWPFEDLFMSVDLDVIDASMAPGVSAPNPCGWTVQRAEAYVARAASHEG